MIVHSMIQRHGAAMGDTTVMKKNHDQCKKRESMIHKVNKAKYSV